MDTQTSFSFSFHWKKLVAVPLAAFFCFLFILITWSGSQCPLFGLLAFGVSYVGSTVCASYFQGRIKEYFFHWSVVAAVVLAIFLANRCLIRLLMSSDGMATEAKGIFVNVILVAFLTFFELLFWYVIDSLDAPTRYP